MLDEKRVSDRLVALIDTFFGVVLGVSVTAIFGESTLLSCPPFNDLISLPNMALIVAYMAIILSWLGYHIMIEENPFKLNLWGYIRFFIDIFIVFRYTVLIYYRKDLALFFGTFPVIFLLYIVGGIIRNKEYGEKVSAPKLSLKYFILLALISIIYYVWPLFSASRNFLNISQISWVLLAILLLLLFLYRIEREKERKRMIHRSA